MAFRRAAGEGGALRLSLQAIAKRFGRFAALEGVSLEAAPGEFLALLGPSGSGKTTLLRIMAGLEQPDEGRVLFDGTDVTRQPVARRNVGFVFQHYALFRHMTVADNIGFGLSVRPRASKPPRAEIARRVDELLELVQLPGLGRRFPDQLSGGQRQRVALARALAVEPRLLLLDEPFGALDARVRKDLRRWLRDLHDRMGLTSVFVTHDQDEALEMADRVVVMDHGTIAQCAAPIDIYRAPASAYVFGFVGESIRVPVTVRGGTVHFAGRRVDLADPPPGDGAATLHFRPHDVVIGEDREGALPLEVVRTHVHAGRLRIEGTLAGLDLPVEVEAPSGVSAVPEGRIGLSLRHARVFAARGSEEEEIPGA
jgi:sulfate transport system ATP-binding protein